MGRLIRSLGHDIRNKLGVIKNSTYYLRLRVGGEDAKIQKHLSILEQEVNALNGIITDLMSYAAPKKPVRQRVQINDLLQRALARVPVPEGLLQRVDLAPQVRDVLADPLQLEHALTNLLLWATDGLGEGASLGVSTRQGDDHVDVRIASAGGTASSQPLDSLLDDNMVGSSYRLALPLIVSRDLIEEHGGVLSLSRQDGVVVAQVRVFS